MPGPAEGTVAVEQASSPSAVHRSARFNLAFPRLPAGDGDNLEREESAEHIHG